MNAQRSFDGLSGRHAHMASFYKTSVACRSRGAALALGGVLALLLSVSPRIEAAAGAASLNDDPHLVGWWKLDETTGARATDSSKQGHHGVLEGGASFETNSAPGHLGRALQFDGKKAVVRVPGYKGITGPAARSLSAWIKTPAGDGDLVRWGKNDAGKMWIFGHVRGRIGVTPKGGYYYMKAGTGDDAWHHVAVVVQEGSPPNLHDHVKLYRDGEVAEVDDIGLLDLWPIETGDELDVVIGRGFRGLIDDLRIYDRPLTEDEVKSLYQFKGN